MTDFSPGVVSSEVVPDYRQAHVPFDDEGASVAHGLGGFNPPSTGGVEALAPREVVDPDFIPRGQTEILYGPRSDPLPARVVHARISDKDFIPAAESAEKRRMIEQAAREAAVKILDKFADQNRRYYAAKKWLDELTEANLADPKLEEHIKRGRLLVAKGHPPMDEERAYVLAYNELQDQRNEV